MKESIFEATLPVETTHNFNIPKYLCVTATNPNKTAKDLENSITWVLLRTPGFYEATLIEKKRNNINLGRSLWLQLEL